MCNVWVLVLVCNVCVGRGVGVQIWVLVCNVWGVGDGVSRSPPSPSVSIQNASVCALKTSPCVLEA